MVTTITTKKIAAVGIISAVLLLGGCSAATSQNSSVSETNPAEISATDDIDNR